VADDAKKLRRPFSVAPSDDTRRVEIADGQWVEFKVALSYGERKRLDAAAVKAQFGAGRGDGIGYELAVDVQRALSLAVYVVDWNLADARGKVVEIPEQPDRRLAFFLEIDADLGDALAEEVEKIQAARLAEAVAEVEAAPGNAPGASPNDTPASPNGSATEPTLISASADTWAAGPSAS
jgi:hypothetical protein